MSERIPPERSLTFNKNPNRKIQNLEKQIENSRSKIRDIIEPRSPVARLKSTLIKRIPIVQLQLALEQSPIESGLHELRGPIKDLYEDLGDNLRESRKLAESADRIREVYDAAIADAEDWEALKELRRVVREDAMKDLRLKRDEDTEELMEAIFESEDPEVRKIMREKTLSETSKVLEVKEKVAKLGRVYGQNNIQAFESAMEQYTLLLSVRDYTNVLYKTGKDIMEAQQRRIQAWNAFEAQVDLLIEAGNISTDVQKLVADAHIMEAKTIDDMGKRIELLEERALKTMAIGSGPTENKSLPEPKIVEG